MPIEVDKPDFMPDDFNLDWPLRADLLSQGDNHLRLIKKAAQNLQISTEDAITLLNSYFDLTHSPVAAKLALKALEADTITGVDFSMFALKKGDYPDLRARGTTAEDVGLDKVENFGVATTLSDSDTLYVRASMLNSLYQILLDEIRKRQPPDLSRYALQRGTYPGLRAQATTKEDVGLTEIENWPVVHTLQDRDDAYSSAAGVYDAYQKLKASISSGASTASQLAGVDSDLKSSMVFLTPGTGVFREYNFNMPVEHAVFLIQSMKFEMKANSGSGSGVYKLKAILRYHGGGATISSVEKTVTVSAGDTTEFLVDNFPLGGDITGTAQGGQYNYQLEVAFEFTKVSGTVTAQGSLGYGYSAFADSSLIQYSAKSNIINFS